MFKYIKVGLFYNSKWKLEDRPLFWQPSTVWKKTECTFWGKIFERTERREIQVTVFCQKSGRFSYFTLTFEKTPPLRLCQRQESFFIIFDLSCCKGGVFIKVKVKSENRPLFWQNIVTWISRLSVLSKKFPQDVHSVFVIVFSNCGGLSKKWSIFQILLWIL